eukprot:scaffold21405_cov50-Attheya_sp.AAC.3
MSTRQKNGANNPILVLRDLWYIAVVQQSIDSRCNNAAAPFLRYVLVDLHQSKAPKTDLHFLISIEHTIPGAEQIEQGYSTRLSFD